MTDPELFHVACAIAKSLAIRRDLNSEEVAKRSIDVALALKKEFFKAQIESATQLSDINLGGISLSLIEREAIIQTLALTDNNRKKTAQSLGIGERTLYRKLKKYKIMDLTLEL